MFNNILVVCIGNVCRSPMAEGLLTQALVDRGLQKISVRSAGLGALVGMPPADHACALLLEKGIDISHCTGRQVNAEVVRQADLILVMENFQKKMLEEQFPTAKGKVFLLGHWCKLEIPDPFQKGLPYFKSTLESIEQCIESWLVKLS